MSADFTFIQTFLNAVQAEYDTGTAKEHSYRTHLINFLNSLEPDYHIQNESKRQKIGAPDLTITPKTSNNKVAIGYIEAKDMYVNVAEEILKTNQIRYTSLGNVAFTNNLTWIFYRNETKIGEVTIGELRNGKIRPLPQNFQTLTNLLHNFFTETTQIIKSSKQLASLMADKARLVRDVVLKAIEPNIEASNNLTSDPNTHHTQDRELISQYESFKKVLIETLTPAEFADIYAQTITYGFFTARYFDPTTDSFNRQEAEKLIPHTNPFLRKLFRQIATLDIDDSIAWIIDDLVQIFLYTDLNQLLKDFGKDTRQDDPVLHFYETFLGEYDPKLRKARGVYYTPEPVVKFIVRAVDSLLKTDFGLTGGLKDNTKMSVQTVDPHNPKAKPTTREIHKVQVLDPATGTGTFLYETIKYIYSTYFSLNRGMWHQYVSEHLLSRLHGFELMMASYTMAHLKLAILLKELGYAGNDRLSIWLTNSLEPTAKIDNSLFGIALTDEATGASHIKNDTPIMVVMGNPPYSVSSSNKSNFIENLLSDYKKNLNEKNIQPLSDDYIKFIRYAENYIERNGQGILAYISNNSFIDGIIHRQMRKHLLETFDKIYILDLHGNSKKKEVCPDGSKDENVFDIMQGVSINIFVKQAGKFNHDNAKVYHYDLWGKRQAKYDFLTNSDIKNVNWKELELKNDTCFFVPKDFSLDSEYSQFISVKDLFNLISSGVKTHHDQDLVSNTPFISENNCDYDYRVFNRSYINYDRQLVERDRYTVMKHMLNKSNLSLITTRQLSSEKFSHVGLSNKVVDICFISNKGKESNYIFPLYLYEDSAFGETKIPNLNRELVAQIEQKIGLKFAWNGEAGEGWFSPENLFDYIYAVLHSPSYREKYKEFLKIDFPRVPFDVSSDEFWRLAGLGEELRKWHLLEHENIESAPYEVENTGQNYEVDKPKFEEIGKLKENDSSSGLTDKVIGNIWINSELVVKNVPKSVWEFYIGGYQPAQKWLKDHKGRTLSFDDMDHYRKILWSIENTAKIMNKIDKK